MTTSRDFSPDSADPLANAMQNASARLDGEFSPDVAHLELSSPQERQVKQFEQSAKQLGELLRSLPVQPGGRQFTESVMAGIVPLTNASIGASQSATAEKTQVSGFRRMTAALIVACAAIALMVMPGPRIPLDQEVEVASPEQFSREFGATDMDEVAMADAAESDRTSVRKSASEETRTQILAEGSDWQVLVIRLNQKDRREVMTLLSRVASTAAVKLEALETESVENESRFGVILTSAPAARDSFLQSVTDSPMVLSSEWNPSEVAHRDRQQVVASIRASMLSPTASELHFGQVLVAVPRSGQDVPGSQGEPMVASGITRAQTDVTAPSKSMATDSSDKSEVRRLRNGAEIRKPEAAAGIASDGVSTLAKGDQSEIDRRVVAEGDHSLDSRVNPAPSVDIDGQSPDAVSTAHRPLLVVFEFPGTDDESL
ncbi:MAG: hypothetical protein KDA91_04020 [Planctomycetaceae bacterium]|nr:hypothetical protein [Planctomycetaceae bacterium]